MKDKQNKRPGKAYGIFLTICILLVLGSAAFVTALWMGVFEPGEGSIVLPIPGTSAPATDSPTETTVPPTTMPEPESIVATATISSVGDLLIISRQDAYQVGDIVVYQSGRIAVTHRIVSISEDEVITRGDANNAEDDPIPPERIKGEVVLIIPCVGYLVNIIKTPLVTLAIIALAVFLMECSFRIEKEKDKQRLEDIKAEIEKLKRDQFPKS